MVCAAESTWCLARDSVQALDLRLAHPAAHEAATLDFHGDPLLDLTGVTYEEPPFTLGDGDAPGQWGDERHIRQHHGTGQGLRGSLHETYRGVGHSSTTKGADTGANEGKLG
jgi:hypothetical protein